MTGAFIIAVLLRVFFTVVRIGAVAMRTTGLPENVARFQCISALTGTGFTTSESEMIVNYPVRRQILVTLMVLGNLGLVSVTATFIVSFADKGLHPVAMVGQALMIASAIGITLLVLTNRKFDVAMCSLIGLVLRKTTSFGKRKFQRMLQVGVGFSVAEHVYDGSGMATFNALSADAAQLSILAIRGKAGLQSQPFQDDARIAPGDMLICYGSDAAHDDFDEALSRLAQAG